MGTKKQTTYEGMGGKFLLLSGFIFFSSYPVPVYHYIKSMALHYFNMA